MSRRSELLECANGLSSPPARSLRTDLLLDAVKSGQQLSSLEVLELAASARLRVSDFAAARSAESRVQWKLLLAIGALLGCLIGIANPIAVSALTGLAAVGFLAQWLNSGRTVRRNGLLLRDVTDVLHLLAATRPTIAWPDLEGLDAPYELRWKSPQRDWGLPRQVDSGMIFTQTDRTPTRR